jgi:hypothetical protein
MSAPVEAPIIYVRIKVIMCMAHPLTGCRDAGTGRFLAPRPRVMRRAKVDAFLRSADPLHGKVSGLKPTLAVSHVEFRFATIIICQTVA